MKTVMTKADVAHEWAHNEDPERIGRTSNHSFSFEGNKLYSYARLIGWKVNDPEHGPTVLLDRTRCSVTTSNHQYLALCAVSHSRVIMVGKIEDPRTDYGRVAWLKEQIASDIDLLKRLRLKIARSRKYLDAKITTFRNTVRNSRAFIEFITRSLEDPLQISEYAPLLVKFDEVASLAVGLKELVIAERERTKREVAERRDQIINICDEWRAFKGVHSLANLDFFRYSFKYNTVLRFNRKTEEVETPKGIRFGIDDARRLYHAFKKGHLLGSSLGNFMVTQVNTDDRTVIAGCHTIAFDEIESCWKSIQAHLNPKEKGMSASLKQVSPATLTSH